MTLIPQEASKVLLLVCGQMVYHGYSSLLAKLGWLGYGVAEIILNDGSV